MVVVEVDARPINEIVPSDCTHHLELVGSGLKGITTMRSLLFITLACAHVSCVSSDSDQEESSEGAVWDDDAHCPDIPPAGGDTGSDSGGPGPKPDPKNCTNLGQFPTVESCKECCFYNHDHVDGWECRRKTDPRQRRLCWEASAEKMGQCNRQCEWDRGGIMTLGVP